MGLVYEYLTGADFRRRLEAIVEAYAAMQDDLEKEKKALTAQWSKRAKHLDLALVATTGIAGDVKAIVGKTFEQIEGLEPRALTDARDHAG
jgi:hypothetical protein